MQSKKVGQQLFPKELVSQELALDMYLSTLLDEIPQDIVLDQVEEKAVEKIKKQLVVHQLSVATKPLTLMPDWSQNEFQALFFRVDELILATPLVGLLRTTKIEKKLQTIPDQPSWFMGLLEIKDQQVSILNTDELILEKVLDEQRDLEQQPYKSILVTYDGKWGLACDEILKIGKLQPEKVRWRTGRTKKPWLMGTVIDGLTSVIDVNELIPHEKVS